MSDKKDRVMQVILAEADVEKGFIPDHAKNKFSDNSGNLKCPFCQQELRKIHPTYVICDSCHITGEDKLWQELICTHKALDKAKNGLKELKDIIACPPDVSYETGVSMYADGVLQEITALEQRGVK